MMEISTPLSTPVNAGRLWTRSFLLLWQGQTVSHLGDQAFSVAMAFWIMEATGSAGLIGLILGVGSLPGVLLMPFGGTFADRYSRIRIIVAGDLVCGIALLGLTGLMHFSSSMRLILAGLFAVSILFGIVRSAFTPAVEAAIPDLVPAERLAAANSLTQFSEQASMLLGKASGGVLYQIFGAPILFLFDGLSFLFAAGSSAFIVSPRAVPVERKANARQALREFLGETALGVRYVLDRTGLRNLILMAAMLNFLLSPVIVLLPFFVRNQLAARAPWYGYLLAALSAGTIAGFLLAGLLNLKGRTRYLALVAGLTLSQALFGILGSIRFPVLALIVMFLAGLCIGVVNIYATTLLQSTTPNELRGRVLGLLVTLSGGLAPIGYALAGWVGDLTHKNVPLVFGLVGALSIPVTLLLSTSKKCREYLSQEVPA
jgi:DHA3 family macrolide efflux protein-like MFS transporter